MAAIGTASIAISRSSTVPAALMPILVSQRFRFDTISLRLGHSSSISAIASEHAGEHREADEAVALAHETVHER